MKVGDHSREVSTLPLVDRYGVVQRMEVSSLGFVSSQEEEGTFRRWLGVPKLHHISTFLNGLWSYSVYQLVWFHLEGLKVGCGGRGEDDDDTEMMYFTKIIVVSSWQYLKFIFDIGITQCFCAM